MTALSRYFLTSYDAVATLVILAHPRHPRESEDLMCLTPKLKR